MNYLSDVRICVTKKHLKILKKELYKIKSNLLDICDLKKEIISIDNMKYVLLGWNNIEWYLNYVDVFTIVKVLKKFKADGITFNFFRISAVINNFEFDSYYKKNDPNNNIKLLNTMLATV